MDFMATLAVAALISANKLVVVRKCRFRNPLKPCSSVGMCSSGNINLKFMRAFSPNASVRVNNLFGCFEYVSNEINQSRIEFGVVSGLISFRCSTSTDLS